LGNPPPPRHTENTEPPGFTEWRGKNPRHFTLGLTFGTASAHRLSDWPQCQLELHCCRGTTLFPVRLLLEQRRDVSFGEWRGFRT